jgi:hypothetical protein
MSLDPRLRDGLQRSMAKLQTDPEPRLIDARRRGRRRLMARRVAICISVAASVVLVAASAAIIARPPQPGHLPASTLTNAPPVGQNDASAIVDSPQAILGSWQSEYVCEDLVQAYEHAGVGGFAPGALVGYHMLKGPPDRLVEGPNLCDGAVTVLRTHVFEPNGVVLDYQGSKVVDECDCYVLVGDHILRNRADPGYPDISLRYVIEGDTLRFDVVVPDPCPARCKDQVQTMVGRYAIGPWHRVTNPAPVR